MDTGAVAVDGGEIHWAASGQGPPVLMIQGVGVAGVGWGPQVAGLGDRFRCVRFDNRGVGASTAAHDALSIEQMAGDALAVMDAQGWDRAHIVGHSMGGLIAQAVALAAPDRVRSLALLCSFARGTQATKVDLGVMWIGMQMRVGTRAMRRRAAVRLVLTDSYIATRDFDELHAELAAVFGRDDMADQPAVVMKQVGAMSRYDPTEQIDAIRHLPTLALTAEHDRLAKPAFTEELAERFGTEAIVLASSGHACTVQLAPRVNELLGAHWSAT